MKRLLSVLLLFVLLLSSCNTAPESNESEDDDYLAIECRMTSGSTRHCFASAGSHIAYEFPLPAEWTVEDREKASSLLLRDGEAIGEILRGEASDTDQWKTVETVTRDNEGVRLTQYVERFGSGDTLAFRYRFVFSPLTAYTEDDLVTMTVRYEELHGKAAHRIRSRVEKISAFSFGSLSELRDGNLLILGNSFIGTCRIGSTLQSLLKTNGRKGTVTAYSRGYATTSTYAGDRSLLSRIRSGLYDGVFLCGFYNINEIGLVETIQNACEEGGAALVLFPAHNEGSSIVQAASARFPTLPVLNWQGELQALVAEKGVDLWALCYDDGHRHSTPLAGYVGAHMIYRAVYGEIPSGSAGIDLSPLGDYPKTGIGGAVPHYVG